MRQLQCITSYNLKAARRCDSHPAGGFNYEVYDANAYKFEFFYGYLGNRWTFISVLAKFSYCACA